jgi:DNA gyrase subunit A
MNELGIEPGKPYKKSARIVGEVMGGITRMVTLPSMTPVVRMAQDWSLRYPFVDGQGNYGSIDDDSRRLPSGTLRLAFAR